LSPQGTPPHLQHELPAEGDGVVRDGLRPFGRRERWQEGRRVGEIGRQGGVHVREQVDGEQAGRRREVGGETRLLAGSPRLGGVDPGGTFTDLVALVGRGLRFLKPPSTPHAPAAAVRSGVAMLGGARRLHYGSTVATNALLERRGARVVIVTT